MEVDRFRGAGSDSMEDSGSAFVRHTTARLARSITPSFTVMRVDHGEVTEYFLTGKPREGAGGNLEPTEGLYARLAAFLSEEKAAIVQERCYGETEAYREAVQVRRRIYSRHGINGDGALSYVGQGPCRGKGIAGVHLWAARSQSSEPVVEPLSVEGRTVGRAFCTDSVRFISIPRVGPSGRRSGDGPEAKRDNAASMFREVSRLLGSLNLSYRNVARTWIYLPSLLEWYGEFNAARRQVYSEAGLISGGSPRWLPASTGIQGGCPDGWDCMIDVLALARRDGAELEVRMLESPDQCEAYCYGSSFSRAVEIKDRRVSRIFVSGTASIDREGNTVYAGDFEAQARHTLRVVRDLLGVRNHGFEDVAQAVVFLKHKNLFEAWRSVASEEDFDHRLCIETVADICREDLLIELEVMTLKVVV